MSLVVSNPTANTTPDQGGTLAVSGIINTGHGSSSAIAAASAPAGFGSDSDGQSRSARWSAFQGVSGAVQEIRLMLSWSADGSASASDGGGGGSASSGSDFSIEYSLNGGANWIGIVSDSCFALAPGGGGDSFTNNSSANILLSPGQDISQIQVRDFIGASANANGGELLGADAQADVTVSVSSIRLEIITQDQTHLLVMM